MARPVQVLLIVLCIVIILGAGVGSLFLWKSQTIKGQHVGELSTELWDESAEFYDSSNFVTLYKEKDKDFVVMNLSDVHQGDFDYRAITGPLARRDIKRMVDTVQPDLITVSGDITCGDSEYYAVHAFTDFMNSLQIPWAPVFGNHDGESANCDRNYLADVMIGSAEDKNNYCLMRKGPSNFEETDDRGGRVGNYVINVVEKGTNKLCQTFFMVDTGRSHLCENQIKWYRQVMRTLKNMYGDASIEGYSDISSTMIMHIPLAEAFYAYMIGYDFEKDNWYSLWAENGAQGNCYEPDIVCCQKKKFSSEQEMMESPLYLDLIAHGVDVTNKKVRACLLKYGLPVNNGLFESLKEYNTTNVLFGHDHLNNFSCVYKGVEFRYSLKNGMGSGYRVGRTGCTLLTVHDASCKMEHYYL